LLTTEANYLTISNLRQAVDHINNKTAQFEIFEQWYIDSIIHGSLDGLKEDNSEFFNNIPEEIGVMFIPVRNQARRVEFMMLSPLE
jgi:hypothetical protein